MSAPMNQPPYETADSPDPTPQDPTWAQAGVYEVPEYKDLTQGSIAGPAPQLGWTRDNLGENDYRGDPYASGSDVNRQINDDNVHGPSYGELGPRAYPN